jgi:hypothetical protein
MVEEWPVAAPVAADRMVERVRGGGNERLRTATLDFFLDPAARLTEQERALMTAMLHGLVGGLADELRVRVPEHLALASECEPSELVADLNRASLLSDERLIAVLLKRADAARVAQAGEGEGARQLLSRFAADPDPAIAAAGMAVALARGRRRDRVRASVELNDLDYSAAEGVVYAIAAVLARRSAGSDFEFSSAATDLLGRHDQALGLDTTEHRLVEALHQGGRLDNAAVLSFAARGQASLLSAALAHLADISARASWDMLMAPNDGELALLLRLAGQSRTTAAGLFVAIGPALALSDPGTEIDRFDSLSDEAIEIERRRLRLPDGYRNVLTGLNGNG